MGQWEKWPHRVRSPWTQREVRRFAWVRGGAWMGLFQSLRFEATHSRRRVGVVWARPSVTAPLTRLGDGTPIYLRNLRAPVGGTKRSVRGWGGRGARLRLSLVHQRKPILLLLPGPLPRAQDVRPRGIGSQHLVWGDITQAVLPVSELQSPPRSQKESGSLMNSSHSTSIAWGLTRQIDAVA